MKGLLLLGLNVSAMTKTGAAFMFLSIGLLLQVVSAQTATVTIDHTVTHQTIDGFGTFGGSGISSRRRREIVTDLGFSIQRDALHGDNIDANIRHCARLKTIADSVGQSFRVFTSVFSPPGEMKDNGTVGNGGNLLVEHYNAFADLIVSHLRLQQQYGFEPYAFSLQNSPRWTYPFASCVYSETQYRDMFKIVGARLKSEGISTRLLGPEDALWSFNGYVNSIKQDPEARSYLSIIGVLGGGPAPGKNPHSAGKWRTVLSPARDLNLPVWDTDFSWYHHPNAKNDSGYTWKGFGVDLAIALYIPLKQVYVSAIIGYGFAGESPEVGLYRQNQKTIRYYIVKQYSKYILPGAVHIETVSSNDNLLAIAFRHEQKRILTVLLINISETDIGVSLSGTSLPDVFDAYRSSATDSCYSLEPIASSALVIPSNSITTLVGHDYDPLMAEIRVPCRVKSSSWRESVSGNYIYTIDGRRITRSHALQGANPGGVYLVRNNGLRRYLLFK